jgi:soluble lytic murein transglycosylase-like protein
MHSLAATTSLVRRAMTGRSTLRGGGIAVASLLALILVPGSAGQALPAAPLGTEGGNSTAPATSAAALFLGPATELDSLRAEELLAPADVRRPLERYLGRYNADRVLVRRISRAVLREARRQQVPPSLIAAVLLTENTTLRPEAQSSVGAQGLMQVMPMHAGARICNSDDLVDVDSNICHGTLILAQNLRRTSSSTAALLRYNGCVRGTNTPDCQLYPSKVLARASRVRQEILSSASALATLN